MVKKALLIGINYKGSLDELRGCINDIRNINDILKNNCDYCEKNIKLLTEEDNNELPTRGNIEKNINWLLSGVVEGDTLFFYYSGHGSNVDDNNGDESDKKDEVLVPLDYDKSGVITDDWLYNNMIKRVPKNVTLIGFTDACHSGTMVDLKYNIRSKCEYMRGGLELGIQYNSKEWSNRYSLSLEKSEVVNGNVYFFSGCQDQEYSADAYIGNTFQGAFSYCLIELIKNNMVKLEDGSVRYINKRIKLRNVLKEINARLDINGFSGQNTQLSLSRPDYLEKTFDL